MRFWCCFRRPIKIVKISRSIEILMLKSHLSNFLTNFNAFSMLKLPAGLSLQVQTVLSTFLSPSFFHSSLSHRTVHRILGLKKLLYIFLQLCCDNFKPDNSASSMKWSILDPHLDQNPSLVISNNPSDIPLYLVEPKIMMSLILKTTYQAHSSGLQNDHQRWQGDLEAHEVVQVRHLQAHLDRGERNHLMTW